MVTGLNTFCDAFDSDTMNLIFSLPVLGLYENVTAVLRQEWISSPTSVSELRMPRPCNSCRTCNALEQGSYDTMSIVISLLLLLISSLSDAFDYSSQTLNLEAKQQHVRPRHRIIRKQQPHSLHFISEICNSAQHTRTMIAEQIHIVLSNQLIC